MKPGIYKGLAAASYFEIPAISKSGMEFFLQSPLHFWSHNLDPNREKQEPSDAMKLGSAIHCAILEPSEFDKRFVKAPNFDRRTKEGKEAHKKFIESSGGKEALSDSEWQTCQAVAKSVQSNLTAQAILEEGEAEVSIVWEDPIEGVLCKARMDWLGAGFIVDLKSTDSAAPQDFARKIAQYNWHAQAAWYMEGIKNLTGEEHIFVFGALEKQAPHACAFYQLDDEALAYARVKNRTLVEQYAKCLKNNSWPSYPDTISQIKLPAWATKGDQNVRPTEF